MSRARPRRKPTHLDAAQAVALLAHLAEYPLDARALDLDAVPAGAPRQLVALVAHHAPAITTARAWGDLFDLPTDDFRGTTLRPARMDGTPPVRAALEGDVHPDAVMGLAASGAYCPAALRRAGARLVEALVVERVDRILQRGAFAPPPRAAWQVTGASAQAAG